MAFKSTLVLSLAALVAANPLAARGPTCPVPGTTTSTYEIAGGPTSTVFASTFYDGVFVPCNGYTAIGVVTAPATIPTATVTSAGQVTSATFMCSPTSGCGIPAGNCKTGTLTSTTHAKGGNTATQYAFTELIPSFKHCSGYSRIRVKTVLATTPTATITETGATGAPYYTCAATSCSTPA